MIGKQLRKRPWHRLVSLCQKSAPNGFVISSSADLAPLAVTPEPAPDKYKTWPGAQVFRVNAIPRQASKSGQPVAEPKLEPMPKPTAGQR